MLAIRFSQGPGQNLTHPKDGNVKSAPMPNGCLSGHRDVLWLPAHMQNKKAYTDKSRVESEKSHIDKSEPSI